MSGVVCGLPVLDPSGPSRDEPPVVPCDEDLVRTYGPAGSLWCPWHGHVLDVLAQPPLTGSVHLNFGNARKNRVVSIEAIEVGLE